MLNDPNTPTDAPAATADDADDTAETTTAHSEPPNGPFSAAVAGSLRSPRACLRPPSTAVPSRAAPRGSRGRRACGEGREARDERPGVAEEARSGSPEPLPGSVALACAAIDRARVEARRVRDLLVRGLSGAQNDLLLLGGARPKHWAGTGGPHAETNRAEIRMVRDLLDRGLTLEEIAALFLDHRLGIGRCYRRSRRDLERTLAYGLERPSKVETATIEAVDLPEAWHDSFFFKLKAASGCVKARIRDEKNLRFAFAAVGHVFNGDLTTEDARREAAKLLVGQEVQVILTKRSKKNTVRAFVPRFPAPTWGAPLLAPPWWQEPLNKAIDGMEARGLTVDAARWWSIWPQIEAELRHKIDLAQTGKKKDDIRRALDVAAEVSKKRVTVRQGRVTVSFKLGMGSAGRLIAHHHALNSLHRPLREAVVPRAEHSLLYADYSSCHLRIRAALSADPARDDLNDLHTRHPDTDLQDWLERGVDVYQQVGDRLLSSFEDPGLRKAAGKKLVLAWSNGSGADRLVDNLLVDLDLSITAKQAQGLLDALTDGFKRFVAWHRDPRWTWPEDFGVPGEQRPSKDGVFKSPLGRVITFKPDVWKRDQETFSFRLKHTALVYAIGEAVEDDAMIRVLAGFEDRLGQLGAVTLLPMYDGVLIEVPEEHAAAAALRLEKLMLDSLVAVCPRVVPKVKVIGPMDCWQHG